MLRKDYPMNLEWKAKVLNDELTTILNTVD